MEHLSNLHLEGSAIRELPVSIELLSGLVLLNLKDCRNLETLPITVSGLKCLRTLKLSGCSKIVKFPETVIKECRMLQTLPRLPDSTRNILLGGCVSLETLSDVLKLNEHQLPFLSFHCVECLKLAGNNDVVLSLLKGYITNSENGTKSFSIIVPGSEIPEWFEYQNNEGSQRRIRIAMSDHLFLYYLNREDLSEVEFDSPSGLELKRCGVHPIYVHQGDKFNQTSDPVWNVNEFGHDCLGSTSFTCSLNDDLDRVEGSGSCYGNDAGSTTSSERSFLKRSLEEYVGAAEASGSGCCNDDEEPQPKRFRQPE
ncbi:hypothetical protein CUMW_227740 [Citrus unshiu]|nr:hypothetical protein CUMW_227740 [Citrus unshiu]